MEKQYRYPGTSPFLEKDRYLFFGRNTDIKELTKLIVLENLVVLFGKSGYGKSSLLNAGVIPELRKRKKHQVHNIRLITPKEENAPKLSPMDLVLHQLINHPSDSGFLTDKFNIPAELPDDPTANIWYQAKNIQGTQIDSAAITLIFDQFEELANFPENQVEAFSQTLAALLNLDVPKSVRQLMRLKMEADPGYFTKAEIHHVLKPLNLKVVFSVHSDHLNLLDKLKGSLPAIFKHTYELQPLNEMEAREALLKPAKIEGKEYKSPVFSFAPEALERIIGSLKDKKTQRIETFQLQLIGQHAEACILAKEEKRKTQQKTKLERAKLEYTDQDLGRIEDIFKNHYKKIIAGLPRSDRGKAIELIEEVLIIKGHRVPLPEIVILEVHHISLGLLNTLVDKRLLRSEVNTVDGLSYELSHDTLVKPIQEAAKNRRQRKRWLWAIAVFTVIIGLLATWGTVEKLRADGLQEKYDKLKDSIEQTPDPNSSTPARPIVPGDPVANASASPASGMAPLKVKFTGSGSTHDGPISYLWEFNDGATSTMADPEHTFGNKGTYNVRLTVTDNLDRKGSAVVPITIDSLEHKAPAAKISATPTSGIAPLKVTFKGSGSTHDAPKRYHWDFRDGTPTSDIPDPVHTFDNKGTYFVQLTVTDMENLDLNNTDSVAITVNVKPTPPFPVEPVAKALASPASGTAPLEVEFTGSGSSHEGPVTYRWDFDDGYVSSEADPVHSFAKKGTYNVQLNITDKGNPGLTNTDSVKIRVEPPLSPVAKATASNINGTAPLEVEFSGSGSRDDGPLRYQWDFKDGSASSEANPVHTFANKGTYNVQLTIEDNERQRDSTIIAITVKPPDPNKWFPPLEPRDSVHLIGIGLYTSTRPFDATQDEGLMVLSIRDKVFIFRSATLPHVPASFLKSRRAKLGLPQSSRKRRPFILTGKHYISYINSNEKFIDYTKDTYEELFDLIRGHTKKGEPYYTFQEETDFDEKTQKEMKKVYTDLGNK